MPPTSYHHGNLRRSLLAHAHELVKADGIQALSLRAVARLAGVSHTAPYRHFPDKAALLATLAEEAFGRLRAHLIAHAGPQHPPLEALQNLATAYVMFAQEHPADFRIMFGPEAANKSAYPQLAAAAEQAFEVVREAIVRGQESRVVRSGDPTELALVAWSLGHGLAVLVVNQQLPPGTPPGVPALAERSAAALYAGLQPARPRL